MLKEKTTTTKNQCVSTTQQGIPVGFPCSEVLLEVILRQRLHRVLRFGLDLFSAVKTLPLSFKFMHVKNTHLPTTEHRLAKWFIKAYSSRYLAAHNCITSGFRAAFQFRGLLGSTSYRHHFNGTKF